jgi:hypothetical protein
MKNLLLSLTILFFPFLVFAEQGSTPEVTLQKYFICFETSDESCVLDNYHGIKSLYSGKPHKIDFKITKKTILGSNEVESWNNAGIIPKAAEGDVSLDVLQTSYGQKNMYSYTFRKYGKKWLIYSHTVWGME